jgi:peptidoglycan/xylan/chitin deacetylase (PgdA/CDA1 family)
MSGTVRRAALGLAAAVVLLAGLPYARSSGSRLLTTPVPAVDVTAVLTVALRRAARDGGPVLRLFGAAAVSVAAWLLAQTIRAGGTTWAVAAVAGAGLGLVLAGPTPKGGARVAAAGAAVGAAVLLGLAAARHEDAALVVAVAFAWAAALVHTVGVERQDCAARHTRSAAIVTGVLTVSVTSWIGANSATVAWFGSLAYHGPRNVPEVALTFDDGPNVAFSLAVRDILDSYGVKGTFFTVGRALDARPDISRALFDDGQLLANHSYAHDYWRWLDPRYPELDRTQRAFARDLGVCPAFFRPPHGQHTPFMARAVEHDHMTMVTWDVSAGDWATHDGQLVARRVLARVRPGSIVLLHDSIDGHVTANRSVLLTALPLILDGLRARGLQPVRLDQLLGRPGYAAHCPGAAVAATPAAPTAG